ncbi:MAG: site-specific integrase [Oscillospiraceae bacterium]|nr:site-specific integrase [Oscillospiraceae bacterium]
MATVEKKTNKKGDVFGYRFRACVGRDEKGKQVWRTQSIDRPEGLTPKREEKEVQRLAEQWEQEQKEQFEKTQSKQDKTKITLSAFIDEHWWKDHVMDGSHTPSSISFYKYMSADIKDYFGDKKRLNQISAEDVKRYIKFLNTEAKSKNGEPYSTTTIVRHYQTLRNILNYAMRFRYLKEDPCQFLSVKDKPQKENKKIDFLAPDEAKRYIACLESEPLYWRCLENVLITTGLRRGECIGLQWEDLDSKKLTLTVKRNVTIDKESEDGYHVGKTKTGEERTVPVSQRLYDMLLLLKDEREKSLSPKDEDGNITSKSSILPHGYIFCREGYPYIPCYPTEPTRWTAKFVKRHNLQNVSPHDLRHTAATLALESGSDIKQVQELLGHKDPATTMQFYAGVTEEAKRRTVEGIEILLHNVPVYSPIQ